MYPIFTEFRENLAHAQAVYTMKSEVTNRDMELILCRAHKYQNSGTQPWIEAQPAPLPYRTCIGSRPGPRMVPALALDVMCQIWRAIRTLSTISQLTPLS